jgi:hypothetical protein
MKAKIIEVIIAERRMVVMRGRRVRIMGRYW